MFQFQWTARFQNEGILPAPGPNLFTHPAVGISDSRVSSYFTLLIFHDERLSAIAFFWEILCQYHLTVKIPTEYSCYLYCHSSFKLQKGSDTMSHLVLPKTYLSISIITE